MKNAIRGGVLIIVICFLVIIILDMSSSGIRIKETAVLANNATYNAIHVSLNGPYEITCIDDIVAEAVKQIVMDKETNSDIEIYILGVDAENCMIDLAIKQTIHHANRKVSISEQRRTVILE